MRNAEAVLEAGDLAETQADGMADGSLVRNLRADDDGDTVKEGQSRDTVSGDFVSIASPIRVGALTIMAARPRVLARFYSRFLRWPYIREQGPSRGDPPDAGYALVCPPEGVHAPALNFDYQPFYQRPRWPTIAGEQTSTMHLDVTVDDLDAGVAWAIDCGAILADTQPNPGGHRVVIDPEGHPICLCLP